ncbi:MAG: TetR/AcrR family transcriptional regulator [Lacisediminihabitans sp.]
MTVVDSDPTVQRAPAANPQPGARQRILDTANRLFYDEGIHAVGIDRLIKESVVTKATFYKHYGAKDTLIVEYISKRHEQFRAAIERVIAEANGAEGAVRELVAAIVRETQRPGFRGCPFVNAAAEYTDSRHPVREVVAAHRDWYTDTISQLLKQMGHPLPGDAADEVVLARDGAMAGAYAGDSVAASAALVRSVNRVLADADC